MDYMKNVPWGNENEINVVVEIPKGSTNKYEYDEKNKYFKLDRTLHTSVFYPFEYGFMPQSRSEDKDALDIIILTETPTFAGCVVKARPIGVIEMEDQSGIDAKIIAVPTEKIEPRKAEIKTMSDIPKHQQKEIEEFIKNYKKLEPNKWVKIIGFKEKDEAIKIIKESNKKYLNEISKEK